MAVQGDVFGDGVDFVRDFTDRFPLDYGHAGFRVIPVFVRQRTPAFQTTFCSNRLLAQVGLAFFAERRVAR